MIINSVIAQGGIQPSGTKSITANGVYDVTNYASADVQVPTTVPAYYIEKSVDANGVLKNGAKITTFTGVKDLSDYVLSYAFYKSVFPANTTIDMSDLTTISNGYCAEHCFQAHPNISTNNGITSVDLSSLTTISGAGACQRMFAYCSGITSVDLSSLTTISGASSCGGMFANCTSLTNMNLNSLETISGNNSVNGMFANCSNLISVSFNKLNVLSASLGSSSSALFSSCGKLESVSFGGLTASTFASKTDQFAYLFNNTTGSTATGGCTVHFPSNFDPSDPNHTFDASTLGGYPTFGGSASYIHVAFDLTATE